MLRKFNKTQLKCLLYAFTSVNVSPFWKMDGDVGCYNIEAKVLLTISNASLSSGNRKFTNDPVSGFLWI